MRTSTVAANPHLKLIFGYGSETPDADVRPFDRDRFVDPQARDALVERLDHRRLRRELPAPSAPRRSHVRLGRDDRARRGRQDPSRTSHRGPAARRQRTQEAGRRDARHLSPAAAGREDGGARPDDFRRRARAEQSARHDPQLGRTAHAEDRISIPPSAAGSTSSSANPNAPRASSARCSRSRASGRRRGRWWT